MSESVWEYDKISQQLFCKKCGNNYKIGHKDTCSEVLSLSEVLGNVRSSYNDGLRFKMEHFNRWVTQEDIDKEFLSYAEEQGVYPALSKYASRDDAERDRLMVLWADHAGVPNLTDEWIKASIKSQEKKPR